MKIGIFGTGIVGRTIAEKLASQEHEVTIGTRDPKATLTRDGADAYGNPPYRVWQAANPNVELATLKETAMHGEMFFNVLLGQATVEALRSAGEEALAGKILIDVTNPLDFSKGMPPSLFVSNTDSLGEQIQRALPRTKVVKSLNTLAAPLMVEPSRLAEGEHSIFVSGDDADAKATVTRFLRESFGHTDVIDLGDITTARGTELLLPVLGAPLGRPEDADVQLPNRARLRTATLPHRSALESPKPSRRTVGWRKLRVARTVSSLGTLLYSQKHSSVHRESDRLHRHLAEPKARHEVVDIAHR
jgi:8-hydroxy-5-deazaflavin:NADPH oxidoreductase